MVRSESDPVKRRRIEPREPIDYDNRVDGVADEDVEDDGLPDGEGNRQPIKRKPAKKFSGKRTNKNGKRARRTSASRFQQDDRAARKRQAARDPSHQEEDDDDDEPGAESAEEDAEADEEGDDKHLAGECDDEDDDAEEDEDEDEDSEDEVQAANHASPPARTIRTDADEYERYIDRLEERRRRLRRVGLVGAATGLAQLDNAIGGLQKITILGGHTQTGKTSLATQFCLAALRRDPKLAVVYFLLDNMTPDDLFDQITCNEARVDYKEYVGGELSDEERKKVQAATTRLRKGILRRMVTVTGFRADGRGLTGERMFNFCASFMRQVGATRVMPVIDMLEDIQLPHLTGDDHKEFLAYVRGVEAQAEEWRLRQVVELSARSDSVIEGGWPVLVLAKLRKSLARHEEPQLEDLLGGVALSYKAQRVFFLVPDPSARADAAVAPVTLLIQKARHGQAVRFPLSFYHTQFRFEEAPGRAPAAGGKAARAPKGNKAANKEASQPQRVNPLAGMER
jgi:hypothetical protein